MWLLSRSGQYSGEAGTLTERWGGTWVDFPNGILSLSSVASSQEGHQMTCADRRAKEWPSGVISGVSPWEAGSLRIVPTNSLRPWHVSLGHHWR
jgi:hypothetical protein